MEIVCTLFLGTKATFKGSGTWLCKSGRTLQQGTSEQWSIMDGLGNTKIFEDGRQKLYYLLEGYLN